MCVGPRVLTIILHTVIYRSRDEIILPTANRFLFQYVRMSILDGHFFLSVSLFLYSVSRSFRWPFCEFVSSFNLLLIIVQGIRSAIRCQMTVNCAHGLVLQLISIRYRHSLKRNLFENVLCVTVCVRCVSLFQIRFRSISVRKRVLAQLFFVLRVGKFQRIAEKFSIDSMRELREKNDSVCLWILEWICFLFRCRRRFVSFRFTPIANTSKWIFKFSSQWLVRNGAYPYINCSQNE